VGSGERRRRRFAVCGLQLLCTLQFAVCSLQFTVCSLQFTVWSLEFAVCGFYFFIEEWQQQHATATATGPPRPRAFHT
jgi:hypothetical protein